MLWRAVNRLTQPQLADELLSFLGMPYSSSRTQLPPPMLEGPSPAAHHASCATHTPGPDQGSQLADPQQQQPWCDTMPPSDAELAEAAYQLVKELMQGEISDVQCLTGYHTKYPSRE